MKVIADMHIHSKYSRATSEKMDIINLSKFAKIKGINLLGTGDFTHPKWIQNLKNLLFEVPNSNLFSPKNSDNSIYFIITSEVNTIFNFEGKNRKIHHLIFTPKLEIAEQINDKLSGFGDLSIDGRPNLFISAPELVEIVMEISNENAIIPAHIWTPWFSIFGSKNGFDRLIDCYQDMSDKIFALETGLSSDPGMNWRLSSLEKYTLISNSDSHSPYPHRLGREANVFEIEELTYENILNCLKTRDSNSFKFTIETNPAYGKYHWTGHRLCNFSVSALESKKLKGICPICKKPFTIGVEERVEDLSDRLVGDRPEKSIDYINLIPLHEIISNVINIENVTSSSVWRIYDSLITEFGNEYHVLIDIPKEEIADVVGNNLAEAIIAVRNNKIYVIPGFDGVYGKPIFNENFKKKQVNLENFL